MRRDLKLRRSARACIRSQSDKEKKSRDNERACSPAILHGKTPLFSILVFNTNDELTQVRLLLVPSFVCHIDNKQTHDWDQRSPRQRICRNIQHLSNA